MTAAETALERELSDIIMGGAKPHLRKLDNGDDLVRQGEPGDEIFLVLDGVLVVIVDGKEWAELGPGAIVGERAVLEGGTRRATLRATTPCGVAAAPGHVLDSGKLVALASGHRREEQPPPADAVPWAASVTDRAVFDGAVSRWYEHGGAGRLDRCTGKTGKGEPMKRSRLLSLVAIGTSLATVTGLLGLSAAGYASSDDPCHDSSADCMISAATKYINALVSHDPSNVPFAPDVRRRENGIDTGDSADAIRQSLSPPTPNQIITGARDIRWFVDAKNDDAIAFYLLDVATTPPQVVHLSERFRVEHGVITEIEAIFSVNGIHDSGF